MSAMEIDQPQANGNHDSPVVSGIIYPPPDIRSKSSTPPLARLELMIHMLNSRDD